MGKKNRQVKIARKTLATPEPWRKRLLVEALDQSLEDRCDKERRKASEESQARILARRT